jgi:folate-binding protein YgfZ
VVLNGETVEVTATHFIGPGYLLSGESLSGEQSAAWLSGLGCRQGTFEQLEQHRLWHRCPTWGQDFNDDYLPQELRRDELAISFTKGCYLGQETVARIDALGHVNRLLTSVKLNGDTLPPVPSDILDNEKVVGQLTSVVRWDAQPGTLLGLATMKRNALQADRQFQCGQIPLTVVEHSA